MGGGAILKLPILQHKICIYNSDTLNIVAIHYVFSVHNRCTFHFVTSHMTSRIIFKRGSSSDFRQ